MDERIQAAIIGASAALTVTVLKDFIFTEFFSNRERQKSETRIYRAYVDPMATAAASLFWRLQEVLSSDGRGLIFQKKGTSNIYDQYKYESTLFRIACLIGWIRGYRRELALLSAKDQDRLKNLRNAISEFESSLADGAHIETQRVRSIAELWDIDLPNQEASLNELGVAVERLVDDAVHDSELRLASELDDQKKSTLIGYVAAKVTQTLKTTPISQKVLRETQERAVQALSIRQAWIYRDFQNGIGDMMIKEISNAARKYDVIGFREFESFLRSDNTDDIIWINRLERIVDDLDVSVSNKFDARLALLENMYQSVAKLLVTLNELEKGRTIISNDLVQRCNAIISSSEWRKTQVL